MNPQISLIPENAPFSPAQRAWLNGFFSGLLASDAVPAITGLPAAVPQHLTEPLHREEENYPWHNPMLELAERMALADGYPLKHRLMAALGQLNCGQCGYDCKSYGLALAERQENRVGLCTPGGPSTRKTLKQLLETASAATDSAPAVISAKTATVVPFASPASASPMTAKLGKPGSNRTAPVVAKVVTSRSLHGPAGAAHVAKDTRHIEIDLQGCDLSYAAGDSLGVYPENCPELVTTVLAALHADGAASVGHGQNLRETLITNTDLHAPPTALLTLLAHATTDRRERERLHALAADEDAAIDAGLLDVLDVLRAFPSARPDPAAFAAALTPLQPRLYSISSSPLVYPSQVHLTVGVVTSEAGGRRRKGVASTFLAERAEGRAVRIFVQPSHGFRPPEDGGAAAIMIGPGTGIAPFRAFLQERQARGDRGRNWLFFGNPHAATDFLYRDELTAWQNDGTLYRLDTAFSRDQAEKLYVQHRMRQAGPDLWTWLQSGAYVFVCGDARHMARDVDRALTEIATEHGGLDEADAQAYLRELTRAGRYQRDVY